MDLLFVPVGDGPTIGAEQAAAAAERLGARWIVPMHYRTPRVGFLETADGFLELMADVRRMDDPGFDTGELDGRGPVAVVPAAPDRLGGVVVPARPRLGPRQDARRPTGRAGGWGAAVM